MIYNREVIKRLFLFVLSVSLVCSGVQAQMRDFRYKFIAKVMDSDTAVVIPNCHIINKTQNLGTVSNGYGTFAITANIGDSILFSAIGYERLTIAVRDSMYTNNRIVKMQPRTYILSAVDIGILSTYDRFKRDVLSKEAEEAYQLEHIGEYDIYVPPLPNQGGINVPLAVSPVTFLYDLWSKEGKQYRHYQSVINGVAEFILIGEKFNGLLVKNLTGFENDELVKFMSFCMFTKEYLLLAPEMEIQREIMRKYKEYIKIPK